MLTRNERIIVEAIRNAPSVTIVIPGDGMTGDTRIKIANKKVSHDVALAVQSHFVNLSRIVGVGTPNNHYRR